MANTMDCGRVGTVDVYHRAAGGEGVQMGVAPKRGVLLAAIIFAGVA